MNRIFLFSIIASLLTVPVIFNYAYSTHTTSGDFDTPTFELRVVTEPRDLLFIEGSGWYHMNETVETGKAPEEFMGYKFVGWKIDRIWYSGNPVKITMDRSYVATAVYSKDDIKHNITIDMHPRIASVIVDGVMYLPQELPLTFKWDSMSQHQISTFEKVEESAIQRHVFKGWNDMSNEVSRTITVNGDKTLLGLFQKQYYLMVVSPYGYVEGSGWYDQGTIAHFNIAERYVNGNTDGVRHAFSSWSAGFTPTSMQNSIIVTEQTVVKASWSNQYRLDLASTVPQISLAVYSSDWYDEGAVVQLMAPKEFELERNAVKYVFDSWESFGGKIPVIEDIHSHKTTVKMSGPHTLIANWKEYYYMDVHDPLEKVKGEGYYSAGEQARLTLDSDTHQIREKEVRMVFDGYDGNVKSTSTSASVLMDAPKKVSVNWKKQYYLDVSSKYGMSTGSGWYDEGESASFGLMNQRDPAGLWKQHVFYGWDGAFTGDSQKASIVMDSPKKVTAVWDEDSSIAYFNTIIIAGTAGGGVSLYAIMKRKTKQNETLPSESDA